MNGKWGIPVATGLLAILLSTSLAARDTSQPLQRPGQSSARIEAPVPLGTDTPGLYEAAAVDTYCTVWYSFTVTSWQGWTKVDNTAQKGTFFHVDDFAGLGGGLHGGLVPIEGTKSLWCGARPNASDSYLCSWKTAPGYGNDWDQIIAFPSHVFTGPVTLSYHLVYDTEPDYDFVYVEYSTEPTWEHSYNILAVYTADGDTLAEHTIYPTTVRTKLRFRFTSDGAWSDEDGLWNTDGACILDEIRVQAAGYDYIENCEAEPVGEQHAGIWVSSPGDALGTFSSLRAYLQDGDPCNDEFMTRIAFFIPGPIEFTFYTPYCGGITGYTDLCQNEMVVSPLINLQKYATACNANQNGTIPPEDLPLLGRTLLSYGVYEDQAFENLVFGVWFVRTVKNGCAQPWKSDNRLYWSDEPRYGTRTIDLTPYLEGDSIQVALGIVDMCNEWYLLGYPCGVHTLSPWYDNARVYRAKGVGPQWTYSDYNLFQDNFPREEFDIESFVRADAAIDVGEGIDIRPGDSIAVDCYSMAGGGIAADPAGGPAVYLHAKCSYIGIAPVKPPLAGAQLQGSVGTYKSDDGTWTIIQCEPAINPSESPENRYAVDLNDELFTRGYMIEYYFTARDVAGNETALPRWARSRGPYFEFTCLPAMNSDVLYVDDSHARGCFQGTAEAYWTPTFDAVLPPPDYQVDRYDVMSPEEGVSNGPGSRAKNKQMTDSYNTVVWDSGDLKTFTISDGSGADKSNDCQLLIDWMNLSEHDCGLWICGDNVAEELDGLQTAPATTLLNIWCGVDLANASYVSLTGGYNGGGEIMPLLTGDADAGIFIHSGIPDKFYVFGGCPGANAFDVLEKTANGKYALRYPQYNATNYYAAISSANLNSGAYNVKTMWFGFGWEYVRDDVNGAPIDRFEIAKDVFKWLNHTISPDPICCASTEIPKAYRLAQNFPNPFNPVTTIRYDLRAKGLVTIKVFDVSGRLVRTLVDEVRDAGSYSAVWNGWNNEGRQAASGIYFYRMEAGDFKDIKKLVLLR